MAGRPEDEDTIIASLTDPQHKNLVPPPRCVDTPRRNRRMAYGIPLTHQNVRWSRFFTNFWHDTPDFEEEIKDFAMLGHMAFVTTKAMLIEARKIWPACVNHHRTYGVLLAFADTIDKNSIVPTPDVVANIQKVLTLEDATVGWYPI